MYCFGKCHGTNWSRSKFPKKFPKNVPKHGLKKYKIFKTYSGSQDAFRKGTNTEPVWWLIEARPSTESAVHWRDRLVEQSTLGRCMKIITILCLKQGDLRDIPIKFLHFQLIGRMAVHWADHVMQLCGFGISAPNIANECCLVTAVLFEQQLLTGQWIELSPVQLATLFAYGI